MYEEESISMSGWDLQNGSITNYCPSEDYIWSLFNHVFSSSSAKANTYKFGLVKSILDNVFNGSVDGEGVFFTYTQIFARFAENYWNLVVRYNLRQMKPNKKSPFSKVEIILKEAAGNDPLSPHLEFSSLDAAKQAQIIRKVTSECKRYVIGALYSDFDGVIYSFDLKKDGLTLSTKVYEFMLRYKSELEKLNYYAWAQFLEKVNDDSVVVHLLDKLDIATPRRNNLSVYREILRREFEENTCFYCGRKLGNKVHVDHFIPWSFVKDDKLWNFVLACPTCNIKKNDRLPGSGFLERIQERNRTIKLSGDRIVLNDFICYTDDLLEKMWHYAKLSGLKEITDKSFSISSKF